MIIKTEVDIDADSILDQIGVEYVMNYFDLYNDAYLDDIEEGYQSDLTALEEIIKARDEQIQVLKSSIELIGGNI